MIVPIIWTLIGVTIIGFYNGLLLLDDKTPESSEDNEIIQDKWHFVGALLFLYISVTAWYNWGIEYVPFVLSSFWLLFGGIVHIVGLKRPFFFVGTTAKTDKLLRKVFPKNPEVGSAIVKLLVFLLSVILIFV